jgi:hypothetical protein
MRKTKEHPAALRNVDDLSALPYCSVTIQA